MEIRQELEENTKQLSDENTFPSYLQGSDSPKAQGFEPNTTFINLEQLPDEVDEMDSNVELPGSILVGLPTVALNKKEAPSEKKKVGIVSMFKNPKATTTRRRKGLLQAHSGDLGVRPTPTKI